MFPISVPFLEIVAIILGPVSVGVIGAVYLLFKGNKAQ